LTGLAAGSPVLVIGNKLDVADVTAAAGVQQAAQAAQRSDLRAYLFSHTAALAHQHAAATQFGVASAKTGENVFVLVAALLESLAALVQRGKCVWWWWWWCVHCHAAHAQARRRVVQPSLPSAPVALAVVGRLNDPRFHQARAIAEVCKW
jgi:hypothetical protein